MRPRRINGEMKAAALLCATYLARWPRRGHHEGEGNMLEVFATKRRDRRALHKPCSEVPEACNEALRPIGPEVNRDGPAPFVLVAAMKDIGVEDRDERCGRSAQ